MSAAGDGMGAGRGVPGMSEVDAAVLSALFDSPISLFVLDPELRLVRFNPSARRVRAFPVSSMVGRPVLDLLHLFNLDQPEKAEQLARDVLETGTPVLDERFKARSRDPVVESVHSVAYFRLHDPQGGVLGVLGVLVAVSDVTARAAAEARVHLLHLAATRIGTSLDVYQTAMELCEVCVPRLADAMAVDVLDSLLRGEAPAPGTPLQGQPLRRAGFISAAGARASRPWAKGPPTPTTRRTTAS